MTPFLNMCFPLRADPQRITAKGANAVTNTVKFCTYAYARSRWRHVVSQGFHGAISSCQVIVYVRSKSDTMYDCYRACRHSKLHATQHCDTNSAQELIRTLKRSPRPTAMTSQQGTLKRTTKVQVQVTIVFAPSTPKSKSTRLP